MASPGVRTLNIHYYPQTPTDVIYMIRTDMIPTQVADEIKTWRLVLLLGFQQITDDRYFLQIGPDLRELILEEYEH